MNEKFCLACGRPFPPRLQVTGTVRRRVVDIVSKRPDGITMNELMALVYADDPNGGPASSNAITVILRLANQQLRPQGYEIRTSGGRGAVYQLKALRAGETDG